MTRPEEDILAAREALRASEEREARLRELLAEAERLSRMKDALLAKLSHELRTPLTSILGWAHLMRIRPPTSEELAKGLEIVERNARVQTQLIEAALSTIRTAEVKAEPDTRQPEVVPVDFQVVDLRGLKVLVVDDQADACELVERVLEECGAWAVCACSGEEALALLAEHRPDLLITDIGMPEMDGYELLRRVRALDDPLLRKLPAIAMTAFAQPEDRTRALDAGFQVHIAKPVEPSELVATVARVAQRA